jgi:hypothetical protein
MAFCTDISHGAPGNRAYCLDNDFFSDWRITWLVCNYPPIESDRQQQAARQAAVWHFSDGYDLDPVNPTTEGDDVDSAVASHYNAIMNSIPETPPPEYALGNVEIAIDPASDTNFLPGQELHPFTVRLSKGGEPLAGYTVTVSSDFGALDRDSGLTDADGEARFTLSSGMPGTASITATATVTLPAGSRFIDRDDPTGRQRLVLGEDREATVQGGASKRWEDADNIVIAHKFEDTNYNGLQDQGETDIQGWTFTLTVPGGTAHTGTTDAGGNAYFYGLVAENGTYTLTETLEGGWANSTPLSRSRSRPDEGGEWTQWIEHFGNAQYSLIEIVKFLDVNADGLRDEIAEPALPGWQFALYSWGSDEWKQLSGGTTGDDGRLTFTHLTAGRYKVVENLAGHPGFTNTTPLEQEVELGYPEHRVVEFGNVTINTATPTSTPTDTPTQTPLPPTVTPTQTPVPPTNTPTVTPTQTPVPPTATLTETPTSTPAPFCDARLRLDFQSVETCAFQETISLAVTNTSGQDTARNVTVLITATEGLHYVSSIVKALPDMWSIGDMGPGEVRRSFFTISMTEDWSDAAPGERIVLESEVTGEECRPDINKGLRRAGAVVRGTCFTPASTPTVGPPQTPTATPGEPTATPRETPAVPFETCPDTTIDLGSASKEASGGQTLHLSGCICTLDDREVEAYLVVIDPDGRAYSVRDFSPLIVPGVVPFFKGASGLVECRCQKLFDHTVCGNTKEGIWTAVLAVLPAGAAPRLENAITFAVQSLEIVHSGGT